MLESRNAWAFSSAAADWSYMRVASPRVANKSAQLAPTVPAPTTATVWMGWLVMGESFSNAANVRRAVSAVGPYAERQIIPLLLRIFRRQAKNPQQCWSRQWATYNLQSAICNCA